MINYASSLTAVDIAVSAATDAFDVVIGQLDWFNAATDSDITPDRLGATWTLSLNFSNPNPLIDTEAFGLTIFNTDNPAGDIISLANLSALSFNLDGVTIDDFQYVVLDGSGRCNGVDTSLSGTSWYNCENNHASLFITADFTAPSAGTGGGAAVSEPATLALLGAGLLGLAATRRRKTSKTTLPSANEKRRPTSRRTDFIPRSSPISSDDFLTERHLALRIQRIGRHARCR